MSIRLLVASTFLLSSWVTACGDDDPSSDTTPDADTSAEVSGDTTPDGEVSDVPDTTPDGDTTPDIPDVPDTTDTSETTDTTDTTDGDTGPVDPEACPDELPAVTSGVCSVSGTGDALLIRGDLVLPDGILERGSVLVVNGLIACVGCDCPTRPEAANATTFVCPDGLVSPGLINAHDHIGFSQGNPANLGSVRYDHRNEWRSSGGVSVPGKPKIPGPANESDYGDSWNELRMVFGGATSYFGSGGAPGLTRNLDVSSRLEGLSHGSATYATFPLGSSGVHADGCGDFNLPNENVLDAVAWVPHVSEGVNAGARNEYVCLEGTAVGSVDRVEENTAFIHGIGLTAADIAVFVGQSASLVWSPRTNTALYGFTAEAPLYHRLGGRVALGTDWIYTGSMNMLRELRCAEEWNARWNNYFSEQQIIKMATEWGAAALGFDDMLGSIAVGKTADITIWDARENDRYRAILDAEVSDVALVMRGGAPPTIDGTVHYRKGRPLYGDPALVDALQTRTLDYAKYDPAVYHPTDPTKKRLSACEEVTVCTFTKKLCLAEQLEEKPSGSQFNTTFTYAELFAAMAPSKTYEAFSCGEPPNEPTCVPSRPGEFTGIPDGSDDDGDGFLSGGDNCPGWFNAVRPIDGGSQPDTDGDLVGDICDPCPLDANTTACTSVDPDDIDGDGFLNGTDNCPSLPNPTQDDGDDDGIGDACDKCPEFSNAGGRPCPATIQSIKSGQVTSGAVLLEGVVATVIGPDFYTVQVNGPAVEFGALYVFTDTDGLKPVAGQVLDVQGVVSEYFDQTQLTDSTFTVKSTGTVPAPLVIDPAAAAPGGSKIKEYEALFVEVVNVTVTNTAPTPLVQGVNTENVVNEFNVTGGLRVDDAIYLIAPPVQLGQEIASLRGVLRYTWEKNKLLPRSAADVVFGAPQLSGFSTSAISIYAGQTFDVTVNLTSAATESKVVTLGSDIAAATVPANVTFAIGETQKTVTITAVSAGNATITATSGDVTRTMTVQVFAADLQPAIVSLESDSRTISLGQPMTVTVTLDYPGKPGGTPVALSATGVALTLPAGNTVIVPAGSTSVEFEVTAGAVEGTVALTASAGGADESIEFTIVDAPPPAEVVFCFDGNTTVSLDVNTTAASTFARGSGLNNPADFAGSAVARPAVCTAATNRDVSSQNWTAARDATKYYEFKVSHGPGRYTISFDARRSGTGPRNLDLVSSTGGNLLIESVIPDSVYTNYTWTGDLPGGENAIRIYGYGAGTATGGTFRLDNFRLSPASN